MNLKHQQGLPYLVNIIALRIDKSWLPDQSQRPKFWVIVQHVKEPLRWLSNECMASGHWNVSDPNIYIVATTHGYLFLLYKIENMDNLWSVWGYAFQSYVLWLLVSLIHRNFVIQNGDLLLVFKLDFNGEPGLAKFALKVFPKIGGDSLTNSLNFLAFKPFFQTFNMY